MSRPDEHDNCPAPWWCQRCGERVCPRCEPSPAEFRLCARCDWNDDGNEAA